ASKHDAGSNDRQSWRLDGSGNKTFHNGVSDLTVDCGHRNPACVGIDFIGSNVSYIRNVRVIARDGEGYAGIRMERYGAGPLLISNVFVQGFNHCIRTKQFDYGPTIEKFTCKSPLVAGIRNENQSLSIRRYTFLAKPSLPPPAIENSGSLLLRNVETSGYSAVLPGLPDPAVTEYSTLAPLAANPDDPKTTLALPIAETPDPYQSQDPNQWARVDDYGATPGDREDDSAAFQAAMNACKPIVYSTGGGYKLAKMITIPPCVRL